MLGEYYLNNILFLIHTRIDVYLGLRVSGYECRSMKTQMDCARVAACILSKGLLIDILQCILFIFNSLAAGEPPAMPLYTDWVDCFKQLRSSVSL